MPDSDIYEALARTGQLLRMDVFGTPDAADHHIVDGLRATTARLVADAKNLQSASGQTAVVTLHGLLAMMGLQIDLDIADVDLVAPQPPLRGTSLESALTDYGNDLMPGGSARPGPTPDVTFVLGDTNVVGPHVRIAGTRSRALVGINADAADLPWSGDEPLSALAAAAAAAAEGVRAAIPRIADRLGQGLPPNPAWLHNPFRVVDLDLTRYDVVGPTDMGLVDAISGGAITNAALYVMLRMNIRADVRVIEPEPLDLSNLNRYSLARRSQVGLLKVDALADLSNDTVRITGSPMRLDMASAAELTPFADRTLVGVDHIPSRWLAQRIADRGWVGVGASSHDYVLVSSHFHGSPCAGCVHPRDDDAAGTIPTISFVSFWAGLVQALELVDSARAGDPRGQSRATHIWPLGLDGPRGIAPYLPAPIKTCPVRCPASASAA